MKFLKIIYFLIIASFVFTGCKNKDAQKEVTTETITSDTKELVLNISGMTCEIGCAKYIQSKLSKQEGVTDAKVIFNDSTAVVKYNPAKTNKASLVSLVNGLADNMYTATESKISACKKVCCKGKKNCTSDKKTCALDTKKGCCKDMKNGVSDKKTCPANAEKGCCKDKKDCAKDKKTCTADAEKGCCKDMKTKICATNCEKECCSEA